MNKKNTLTLSSFLFLICSVALFIIDGYIKNETVPNGIVSVEFIYSIENFNTAMLSWDGVAKSALGMSLGLDFLYIVFYSLCLYLLLILVAETLERSSNTISQLLYAMAYFTPCIGALDVVENWGLIQMLLGSQSDLWAKLAFYCAAIKFSCIALCVLVIAIAYVYAFAKSSKS